MNKPPVGANPHKIFRILQSNGGVPWQVDFEIGNTRQANSPLVLANACLAYAKENGYASCDIQWQLDNLGERIVSIHTETL